MRSDTNKFNIGDVVSINRGFVQFRGVENRIGVIVSTEGRCSIELDTEGNLLEVYMYSVLVGSEKVRINQSNLCLVKKKELDKSVEVC